MKLINWKSFSCAVDSCLLYENVGHYCPFVKVYMSLFDDTVFNVQSLEVNLLI